jgi:hypothetical protein
VPLPSSTASSHDSQSPFFRHSHRNLLQEVRPRLTDRLRWAALPDAIIVPTSRPSQHRRPGLRLAIQLATRYQIPLVVICSRDAASHGSLKDLAGWVERSGRHLDVEVLVVSRSPTERTQFQVDAADMSLAFRRSADPAASGKRKLGRNDVGRKRNLGLLLARTMGWRTVLFLDDDIVVDPRRHTLDRASLAAAVRWLSVEGRGAVGWTARSFPDNSVFCRMRSQVGYPQEQFIGGGALVVRVDYTTPFFPAIYNEDWLFMLGFLRRHRRAIGEAGWVGQASYKGFSQWRARSEEFGDLLAEALMTQAGQGRHCHVERSFWVDAFRARRRMRDELHARVVRESRNNRALMMQALFALKDEVHESLRRDEAHWSSRFAAYTLLWEHDLHSWEERMRAVAQLEPMDLLTSGEFDLDRSRVLGSLEGFERFAERHARRDRPWRRRIAA